MTNMAANNFEYLYRSVLLVTIIFSYSYAQSEHQPQKLKQESITPESVPYSSPNIRGSNIYFAEHFDNIQDFKKKWVFSKAKKPDVSEDLAQYDGKWELLQLERFPLKGDTGLVLVTESRHAAIASKFLKPFNFDNKKKFIVQYVVTFQKVVDCGGAYMKLLTDGALDDLSLFNDKTPYTIMFGPDKCGGIAKMHFIIRHKNPINGTISEKHCTKLIVDEAMYKDQEPYLLKLVIEPDNNFAFYINNELQYQGNLLDDEAFNPPINPPKEVIDVTDVKPKDWDDRPKIPDPIAVKPEDWDEGEPEEIPDVNAVKPEDWLEDEPLTLPNEEAVKPNDWDEEMDGEWEPPMVENSACKDVSGCGTWNPPMINNPKFKGKWKPLMIDNPDYKGKWVPRKIPNPEFYYDDAPLKFAPIGYVGFELWSLVNNMYFDDILVTDNEEFSQEWIDKTWNLKKKSIAAESASFYKLFLEYTNNYPWLWAVYVLLLAVIVGIIGTCCIRTKKNKDDFEKETLHKKTDDYQATDEIIESEQRQSRSGEDESLADDKTKLIPDLQDDETDPEEKNSRPSSDEETEAAENLKNEGEVVDLNDDKSNDQDDEQKDFCDTQSTAASSSPRKRRPRRD